MDLIIPFFFIFGIFFISNYVQKKYFKENSILISIFIFNKIIGILYFFLIYLFILNLDTKIFSFFILFICTILGTFTFVNFIDLKKIKLFLNEQNYLFYTSILFLFLFLINSMLPPADLDSLRYHLEIPKKIINDQFYDYITLDYTYLGAIEFLNLFGLNLNFENTSSLINFIYLLFLVMSNFYIFDRYKIGSKNIGNLIVLSSPYLVSMVSAQKIYFLPCYIVIYSFTYLILHENKIKFRIHQLISSVLIFSIAIKTIFVFYAFFIFLFQIYILRNNYKKIFYLLLTYIFFILLFIFPIFILKFKLFGNPFVPFLDFNGINSLWLNDFRSFLIKYEYPLNFYNLLFFPIKIILPFSFITPTNEDFLIFNYFKFEYGNIFKLIGVGIFGIFFIKYKNHKIYIYLLLLILSFLLIGNLQNRWFFPLLLFVSIFYSPNNYFDLYFKKILLLQSIFVIILLLLVSIISIKARFFDKESVLESMAYGYKFSKKIEKKYPDSKIVTYLENYYYLKNYLPLFKHDLIIKFNQDYFIENLNKNEMFVFIYNKNQSLAEIKEILNIEDLVILNKKTYNESFNGRFPLNKFETKIYLYELIF